MNSNSQHQGSTREQQDQTKDELEREKLRLEIAELGKQWWKKPTYLCTLLAIGTLSIGFITDKIQSNSAKLDTERAVFERDKKDFELGRDPVQRQRDEAVRDRENFRIQLGNTAQQLESKNQELSSTRQELAAVKEKQEFDNRVQQILNSTANSASTLTLSKPNTILTPSAQSRFIRDQITQLSLGTEQPQSKTKNSKFAYDLSHLQESNLMRLSKIPPQKTWYQSLKGRIAAYVP
jgi:ribosomal protein S8E